MDERAKKHNDVAQLYDRMRPAYPKEMFEKLQQSANLTANSRILEVGAGTGQATVDLAKITPRIVSLEPGSELVRIARAKVPGVNFVQSTFEDFVSEEPFDCIFSAAAWHWVDPTVAYRHASESLTAHGYLAIANNFLVETDPNAFLNRAQPIFAKFNTLIGLVTPDQIVAEKLNLESQKFQVVSEHLQPWQHTYTIDEYIALRRTFAAHQWMHENDRKHLERELRQLCESEFNGQVTQSYRAVLFVAAAPGPQNT
jgi:trans-aconitate methyltransferase